MVIRYEAGGKYQVHADSDCYDANADVWYKCMDRDVSLLMYLNEDFTGGALHFTHFNYSYQPKTGDLVFFPSDHRFMHEAQAVKSGERYVVTSWAAFRNEPRVMSEQPANIIQLPMF